MRSALDRRVSGPGVLEDAAAVALGFIDLYSLTFEPGWLQRARDITERTIERFHDTATSTWYDTASDHEALIVRPREVTDNATPSGTSLVAELLQTWSELEPRPEWLSMVERIVGGVAEAITRYPQALGHIASVADTLVHGGSQVALAGDPADPRFRALVNEVSSIFVPALVLAGGDGEKPGQPALMRNRHAIEGRPTAYICRAFTCALPTSDPEQLQRQVRDLIRDATEPVATYGRSSGNP
jgi:uncharacterized protein YyaL (SSP411 family)